VRLALLLAYKRMSGAAGVPGCSILFFRNCVFRIALKLNAAEGPLPD
jgi:hypothetical protein